jgi:hypothetical protein
VKLCDGCAKRFFTGRAAPIHSPGVSSGESTIEFELRARRTKGRDVRGVSWVDGERRDLRGSDRATTVWRLEWPRVQVWSGWRIATDRRRLCDELPWFAEPHEDLRATRRESAYLEDTRRVVPVDDRPLLPDELRTTLSLDPAMRQVGEAGSGGEALESTTSIGRTCF